MKKFTAKTVCAAVSAVLGFISLFSLFMPMFYPMLGVDVGRVGVSTDAVNGWKMTFGFSDGPKINGRYVRKYQVMEFSFMNFLNYVILVVGLVAAVFYLLRKMNVLKLELPVLGSEDMLAAVAAGCFFVSGILFFCCSSFAVYGKQFTNARLENYPDPTPIWGAILTGTLLVIAAACMAATLTFTESVTESVVATEAVEKERNSEE